MLVARRERTLVIPRFPFFLLSRLGKGEEEEEAGGRIGMRRDVCARYIKDTGLYIYF